MSETYCHQQAVKVLLDHGIEPYLLDNPRSLAYCGGLRSKAVPVRLAVTAEDEGSAREALKAWEAAGRPNIAGYQRSLIRWIALSLMAGSVVSATVAAVSSEFRSWGDLLGTALFSSFLVLCIAASVSRRLRLRRLRDGD